MSNSGRRTILVVDDENDLINIIKITLERYGYFVHDFSDPVLALRHIKEDRCNECKIALCDIKMPVMTGLELAVHLKRIRPDLIILLMSAMPIDKEKWRKVLPKSENVDDFIPKPFTMADLIRAVKKWQE